MSYGLNANVLIIFEENNYYPFGLKHKGYNDYTPTSNNYKYNGKELQDELGLNMYDYGARNYDPAIGRWMNIDPLAELSRRFSPYTYALNNPAFFIDPDGMKPQAGQSGTYYDWDEGGYRTASGATATYDEAIANHSNNNKPDDWIENKETGEVKWFQGTGGKAEASALNHWGFFDSRGKTKNLGSSFFGTRGTTFLENSQIITEQISYLLAASLKINSMAGVKQDGVNNLAFEYLMSVYFGTSFGKSPEKKSELPGVIWDYGGGVKAENYFVKGLVSRTSYTLFDAYISSQDMGLGSDKTSHVRADAVNYFKTTTANYITPTTLFNINLHKF